jgi:hypothetical protein
VSKGHINNTSGVIRIPLSAAAPAAAAPVGAPKITTAMNGNTVTISADGITIGTVTYVKNGKTTLNKDGYVIDVEFNGSGVKSTKLVSYPVPEVVTPKTPDTVYLAIHCDSLTWKTNWEWVITETAYEGTLKLTISKPYGDPIDYVIINGEPKTIDNLAPGTYVCTLTGDGFEPISQDVLVKENETASILFDGIKVIYPAG